MDHLDKPIGCLEAHNEHFVCNGLWFYLKLVHDKGLEAHNGEIPKEHFVCNDLESMTHYEKWNRVYPTKSKHTQSEQVFGTIDGELIFQTLE